MPLRQRLWPSSLTTQSSPAEVASRRATGCVIVQRREARYNGQEPLELYLPSGMGSDLRLDHSADFDIMLEVRRKSNPMSIPVVHTCVALRVGLAAVVITLSLINVASAQTVWSGLAYTYTKAEGTDPQLGQNQDRITNNVWITRGLGGGLLNAATECDLTS